MYLSPRNPRVMIAASALALVVALSFFIYTHLHAIQVAALAKAHDLIQSALEEGLGRKVTVGAITSAGLDSLILADVVVPAGPGEGAGAPVLEVSQVVVNYSLLDIIFRRKPVAESITSVALVKPVARAGRAPDGRIWPYGLLDPSMLSLSAGGAQGFSGSVSVRGGRLEFSGVPGVRDTVAVEGIEGTLSFAGTGLAWRASARAGPNGELHLAATGTFDTAQKALACDATVSGAMPAELVDIVRRVLEERPDLLARVGARLGPEVLAYFDAAGKAELTGGKVQVDVYIRPGQDGGRLARGEVSLAEARVIAEDPAPWVRTIQGTINLASEFQADSAGFSCQGKASVSVERAECDGSAAGLGEFEAGAQAVVDFWQKAGEDLCFEGRADLDIPHLSMGDAVRKALAATVPGAAEAAEAEGGTPDGALEVDGPLEVSLAFAGRASKGVDVWGKIAMAGGRVLAENIVPGIPSVAGDIGWELEFSRDAKGALACTGKVRTAKSSVRAGLTAGAGDFAGDVSAVFTFSAATGATTPDGEAGRPDEVAVAMVPAYSGEVEILSGTARASRPTLGLTSAKGAVTGRVSISGVGAGPAKYSGTLRISEASIAMARPQAGLKSFETGASGTVEFEGEYPGKAKFQGSVALEDGCVAAEVSGAGVKSASGEARTRGKVLFAGEYPGRIEYRGTMDASRGRVAVREGPGGLARWETGAEAHVDFEGEYPGKTWFRASCSFPDGEVEIANGPGGIASASGRASGQVNASGSLPGDVKYGGHIVLADASVRLVDAPGGIKSLSGTAKVTADFAGSSAGGLRYSGTAELLAGQVAAVNMPGGVQSLKGSAQGSLRFAGVYPGVPEFEGSVSVRDADLVVGEIPGVVRSLSGRVTGEISFRAREGSIEEYSGKAAVGPATFVSDGVYPGVTIARGPVRLDMEFSSTRGGHLAYKGKATIAGADLRAGRLFPGLVDIAGKVDSSFDFESTPEGVKYRGSAKVAPGRAVLGGEAVPGLERMDGDIVVSLDFQGVGGKAGTYSGKARISGGTLRAGEVAKGIERIEGPASLDVAFSGGVGTGALYSGTVSVRDASFRAAEIVPGMKSVTGKMSGDVSFTGRPDGSVSYEGSADLDHASFAAGAVYPGIKELGGNGKAHLTFSNTGGSGIKGTAEIIVARGVLAHDAIGSRVEDIAAQISVGENLVEIKGMTGRLGASRIEASGWFRPGKRVEIDLALKSRDLVLADLGKAAFAGFAGKPAVLSGSAGVDLKLRGYYPNLQYAGQIALKGVTVKHPALGAPVRDISGLIALSGKKMTTESLNMTVAGLPVKVRGEITDPLDPRFDVTVSVADADIHRLVAFFAPGGSDGGNRNAARGKESTNAASDMARGISGKGSITARLTGTAKEFFIEGAVDLAALTVPVEGRAIAASGVKGRFRYGEGALTLRQVVAQVAGGNIALDGAIIPGEGLPGAGPGPAGPGPGREVAQNLPAVRITAELKGVSAGEIAPLFVPPDITLSGTLDGNLVVTGGGPDGAKYSVAGSCRMTAGGVASEKATFAFTSLEASFRAADGKIAFDRLVARGADGDIDARGTVSRAGEVNLRAMIKGASLAKLARLAGYDGASGIAGFAGTVSGRGRDVVIDGLADVEKGAFAGMKFDALTGRVRLSRSDVYLDGVSVRSGKASYLISGKAGLDAATGHAVDLVVQLAGVPCQDVLSFVGAAGGFPLKGLLSGEVVVKGTSASPEARGSVKLSGAELSGVKLDRADMDFAFTGGTLHVERLEAKVGPAGVAASGTIGKDGVLDLSVDANDVDLAKLPVTIPGNLVSAGVATFEGKVAGDVKAPRVEGRVSATNVVFRDVLLLGVAGTVRWDGKKIELVPLAIHDGSGDASVTGTITPAKSAPGDATLTTLNLELEAKGLGLKTVLDLVHPGYSADVTGKVTGRVALQGSVASPDVEVALQASDLDVEGVTFASAVIDARATAGDIELRVLRLRQEGGGYLEASGTSKRGGVISFMASARGFNASVLSNLLGVGYAVSGVLDLAAKIEGTSSDPSATVAMQLTDGAVERVRFDAITARMLFRGGVITIEEGEIVQGRHSASVTGRVPLAGKQLAAFGITPPKRQENLDLAIRMKDASLVLLMMVSDQIEWSEGTTNVDLRVTGSLNDPQLHGHVRVSDGTVKLAPLGDALKDMTARVVFNGTEASIEEFSCRLGDGSISASGTVGLVSSEGPKLDVRVSSKRARVNTGLIRALVDAHLAVYGSARRPLLSGDIKLTKAEVAPSGFGSASVPFDADLALTVSTEGDLRVRTKIMDVPASGRLKVGGTLKQPTLAGRMEAHRGWFAYFGNEFTVREAAAEFREDGGVMPYLEVQAETHAGTTSIYLTLKGMPPDGLAMDLTSSPPKSRDEILALLNYPGALAKILEGDVEGAMKEEIARIFDQELRLQLVSGIERAFEDALSLDEFRLQRGTSNELRLRIGKYVVDDLYLSYEKGFGPQSSGVLRLDYMYGPGVVLTGKFDERGIYTFGIEARLRF
ncbi:MAG: translocation/assembly module TamB domain-containing protein [Bacillota bacterium]|nr:translocation/assembly module TamB domain-containing protein [Bacillota bacterium]